MFQYSAIAGVIGKYRTCLEPSQAVLSDAIKAGGA
jgi:hypothetical protein